MLAPFARIPAGFSLLHREVFRTRTLSLSFHSRPTTNKVSDVNSFDVRYWIFGDDPHREPLPTLRVGKKTTVSALKKAIMEKERHILTGIPAKSLEIWKVSIAVESLRVTLAELKLKDNPQNGVEKLAPQRRLSGAFPDLPMDSFLHLVRPPPGEHESFG